MTSDDPVDWLERVPQLGGLSRREIAVLADFCEVRREKTGKIITRQGERCTSAMLLVEGRVACVTAAASGAPVGLFAIEALALLGTLHPWAIKTAPFTLQTLRPSVLLVFPQAEIAALEETSSPVSFRALDFLYQEVARSVDRFSVAYGRLYRYPEVTLQKMEQAS